MAERQRSVEARLKLAAILVIGLIATMLLADAVVLFAIQAEFSLVDQYGFGHVPRAEMAPFINIGTISPAVGMVLGLLKLCCFAYFLYLSAKALDRLDIAHRFSKVLTGLSIIIPFVSFYLPWAALGEARQTFKRGAVPGTTPPRSVRGFDSATFWFGVVWIFNAIVGGILGRLGDHDKVVDLASFRSTLETGRGVLIFGMISGSLAGLAFILYARNFLRLYRVALARTVTDVFEDSPGAQLPAPPAPPFPDMPRTRRPS